jgi:hypothetical protein
MATYEELIIDQGADVSVEIELVEQDGSKKDLTGYSVAAKMKRNYNSTDSADVVDFTAGISTPATDGVITISLTNTQTDALSTRGRYVYDVEISNLDSDSNTIIERVLEGKIRVSPSVTR